MRWKPKPPLKNLVGMKRTQTVDNVLYKLREAERLENFG